MPLSFRRCLSLGAAALAVTLATPAVFADYLYAERGADQSVKAYLSNFQPGETLSLAKLVEPQVVLAADKRAPLTVAGDSFTLASAPAGDVRLSAKLPEGSKLTIYEAREGRSDINALNDLELVPTTANGNTFKLHWKGNIVAASQVNVYTTAGWNRTLKPGADGSITLDTPFPGRYVLEVVAQINGSAKVDGKSFDSVVHIATLSFAVPR